VVSAGGIDVVGLGSYGGRGSELKGDRAMPGPTGPINIAQVQRGHELFMKQQDAWIVEALEIAKAQASEHVKKRSTFKRRSPTRSLKDSTKGRIGKTRSGRKLSLRWYKKYASFIEYGTRPHPVNHPGTRPYKFGWKATSSAHRGLIQRLDSRVRNARFRF
jgi:hypothetical protein